MLDTFIDITLLIFLATTAIAIIKMRNLFVVIMLFSIFSLHSAGLFVVMDAASMDSTPVAAIDLPRIPNGFHGSWIPASVAD